MYNVYHFVRNVYIHSSIFSNVYIIHHQARRNAQDKNDRAGTTEASTALVFEEHEEAVFDGSIELQPLTKHDRPVKKHHKQAAHTTNEDTDCHTVDELVNRNSNSDHVSSATSIVLNSSSAMTRCIENDSTDSLAPEEEIQYLANIKFSETDAATERDETSKPEQLAMPREMLSTKTKLWLLATKGLWFVLGGVLVVVAGIVGHFQSNLYIADNCTNTTAGNYTL